MGTLRQIDITKVHAIRTDDSFHSIDEVYYFSFVNCGEGGMSGNSPGSQIPVVGKRMTQRSGSTLTCPQGVEVTPHTYWGGRLYPTHPDHETCCQREGGVVSGPLYFFDSDDTPRFVEIFGLVVIILVSVGVSALVGAALAANPWLAIGVGWAAGVATGAALAALWRRLLKMIAGDDYLGGIRIRFPCQYDKAEIVETHDLQGAANGIQSDNVPGQPPVRWDRSSAVYKVTFKARYG